MRKSFIVNFGIIGCLLMITSFSSQATYLKDLDILEVSSEDEVIQILDSMSKGNRSKTIMDFINVGYEDFYGDSDVLEAVFNNPQVGVISGQYRGLEREHNSEYARYSIWEDEDGNRWYIDNDPNDICGQIIIAPVEEEDERYSSDRRYYIFDVYHGNPGKLGELHNAARNVAAKCNTGDVDSTMQNIVNYINDNVETMEYVDHKWFDDIVSTYGALVDGKVIDVDSKHDAVNLVARYCGIPCITAYYPNNQIANVYVNSQGGYSVASPVFARVDQPFSNWPSQNRNLRTMDYEKCMWVVKYLVNNCTDTVPADSSNHIKLTKPTVYTGDPDGVLRPQDPYFGWPDDEEESVETENYVTSQQEAAQQDTQKPSNTDTPGENQNVAEAKSEKAEANKAGIDKNESKTTITGKGYSIEQISKGLIVKYDTVERPTYKVEIKGVSYSYFKCATTTATTQKITGLLPGEKYQVRVGINSNFQGTDWSDPVTITIK